MHPLCDEFKSGTCEWCGDQGEVYADTSRCEDCDSCIIHCSICKQDQHEESSCRHVFRDQDFEWTGSGGYSPSDTVKKSFGLLLERMPTEFASELRQAVASNEFHTFLVAPLIGGGGTLWLYGMPDPLKWGERILEIGESEDAEKFTDGDCWLASLYNDQTPEASRTTLEWIDEHLRSAAVVEFPKGAGA